MDEDTTAARRPRKRWRRALRGVLIACGALVAAVGIAFGIGYLVWPIPDPVEIAARTDQSVLIAHSDGSEMTRIVPSSGNRTMVDDLRADVSKPMRDATLAAEDASFYRNSGFDPLGIVRAAWSQVTGGVGGGSTLTQQYVKLATGADEHTYTRKFKEVVLAFKVTNELPKDEILQAYLNTAYYGRGAYGVHAAAEAYFGKPPADLDPSEAALLAGMVQRPTENDPAYNAEQGRARWEYVAGQLRRHGMVDDAQAAKMRMPGTRERFAWRGEALSGTTYEIRQQVLEEAERAGFTEGTLQRGGYSIITTIDAAAQRAAEQAVAEVTARAPGSHAALVAIEPGTGAVRAYHSGATTAGGYDWAAAPQHPGTAFEPFAQFLQLAGSQASQQAGCEGPECSSPRPQAALGAETVRRSAARLGFDTGSWEPSGRSAFDALMTGEQPVSATDVAHAYATIAADGQERKPRMLSRILDRDGREVLAAESAPHPAFAADAGASALLAREVAGSRWPELARSYGTEPLVVERGRYHSMTAWTSGFTPRLATSVVLSATDEQNRSRPLVDADGLPLDGTAATDDVWRLFEVGRGGAGALPPQPEQGAEPGARPGGRDEEPDREVRPGA
ncbi:transglycosylase domain-containing protein [Saccharopolyspora gregorii]|uniref:transglycosylase domain-containing protein n=1 Tax=Saccharopolyspora gregorii TaxID=33914 RepID=UPI0031EA0749